MFLDLLPLRPVPEEYEQAVAHLTVTEKDIESFVNPLSVLLYRLRILCVSL